MRSFKQERTEQILKEFSVELFNLVNDMYSSKITLQDYIIGYDIKFIELIERTSHILGFKINLSKLKGSKMLLKTHLVSFNVQMFIFNKQLKLIRPFLSKDGKKFVDNLTMVFEHLNKGVMENKRLNEVGTKETQEIINEFIAR